MTSMSIIKTQNPLRLGRSFNVPKTEQNSPRNIKYADSLNKPLGGFISKTKRTNLIDDRSPGPGVYNPQTYTDIATQPVSQNKNLSCKNMDFGSKEEKIFTIFRNMESPFVDVTLKDNPSPWNY